jgi:glucose-1-phosphate thymidylyltransferase
MKAVILAAGYSGRSFPLMRDRPKALLLVNDKPVVEHIVDKLKEIKDINKIYLVTNEKYKNLFKAWLHHDNVEVISDQTKDKKEQLGAVGSLNFALQNKSINDDLLVVAGDNLFTFNLNPLTENKNKIKIGVYNIKDQRKATDFGVVKVENNKLIDLKEKPEKPDSSLISTACYYFPKKSLKHISSFLAEKEESELGHLINYIKEKEEVYTHNFEGKWFDIGTDSKLKKVRREYV